MESLGFIEFQTPILTASSPEGARDFVVPSWKNKGKFYALPQAPQQFKQLLMVSGFHKYFQIAPCFRDEAQRADRSPGEFYQLDVEMSFAEKEDVFREITDVIYSVFKEYSSKEINKDFIRIPYDTSMLKYGNDKPDLRNPIEIFDANDVFKNSGFSVFENVINSGGNIRCIPAPKAALMPRSFFDNMIEFAKQNGAKGLAWIKVLEDGSLDGVPAKFINQEAKEILFKNGLKPGDAAFFASGFKNEASKISGLVRTETGKALNLIDENKFYFCWIVDFPYFEYCEDEKKIIFSHNPFSKPNCTLDELRNMTQNELLNLKADQYDIVCNGVELSSGAVRNYNLDLMFEAFKIAGHSKEDVEKNFQGMVKAFKYGPPPHAGIAPGIDRIVMLLTDSKNIREVTAFPMTSSGEDLLMNAPSVLSEKQLKELGLKLI